MSLRTPFCGPPMKAIRLAPGIQRGLASSDVSLVNCTSPEPSAFITKMSAGWVPVFLAKTIRDDAAAARCIARRLVGLVGPSLHAIYASDVRMTGYASKLRLNIINLHLAVITASPIAPG